jgi:hypothetical protein
MRYILYLVLGYLLYRFVTGFLIPVFKTSSQIRQQFNDMQNQMNNQKDHSGKTDKSTINKQVGEYIDFEDVKSK